MPSEDIKNLFSRFGSRSGQYREIVREEQSTRSIDRWPLLSTVEAARMRDIPGVHQAAAANRPSAVALPVAPSGPPAIEKVARPPAAALPAAQFSPAPPPVDVPTPAVSRPVAGLPPLAASSMPTAAAPEAPAPLPVANPPKRFMPAAAPVAAATMVPEPAPARPLPNFGAARHQATAMPSGSLSEVFVRLAGPQEPDPAAAVEQRALPAFRRLRRT